MIQLRSIINVADNSGARKIQCFHVKKGHYHRYATVGDIIVASVRDAMPNSAVKKGEKVRAVIVRTVKNRRRPDGSYVRFDDNAACLIDDAGEPRGTRVFGPVARELRDLEYLKIISLAPEVV